MPYDPQWPQNGQNIDADIFRSQFAGIIALINGAADITGAVVDGVNTLNPGDPAAVNVAVVGTTLHFTFGIPRGNGGNDGAQGAQGPPFSTALVDGVTTLNPGDSATVQTIFDGANVRFTFGIPRGNDGAQGGPGGNGSDGSPGSQGPPGEVTNAQLSAAITGTSNNTNGVSTLGLTVSDPPTQSEMQQIVNKLDELILNGRR